MIQVARSAEEEEDLQRAVRRAQALPEHDRVRATPKIVSERLHALRAAAKPGRTQMRNSHIKAALGVYGGCEALAEWTELVQRGLLTDQEMLFWTESTAAAFRKPNGGVRPVTLCEALLKVATGVVRLAAKRRIQEALYPMQFGGGVSAGPEQVLFTCKAVIVSRPGMLLGKLDLSNAYGRQRRAPALNTVLDECPYIAPLLAAMWKPGHIRVWVQVGATEWRPFYMSEGLLQGELLSSPAFCSGSRSWR